MFKQQQKHIILRITLFFLRYVTVHGQWSSWTNWTECSATCGGGLHWRSRACNNPAPQYDGQPCLGKDFQNRTCSVYACPCEFIDAWNDVIAGLLLYYLWARHAYILVLFFFVLFILLFQFNFYVKIQAPLERHGRCCELVALNTMIKIKLLQSIVSFR